MNHLKSIIALFLCLSIIFGLFGCAGEVPTSETTENEVITTKPETTIEETTEMEEIKEKVSLDLVVPEAPWRVLQHSSVHHRHDTQGIPSALHNFPDSFF